MDDKVFSVIGLVAGLLIAVGVFGTWGSVSVSATYAGIPVAVSIDVSGWGLAQGMTYAGITAPGLKLPYVALIGGILALIAGIIGLVKPGIISKLLLSIGGMMGLIGIGLGLAIADVGGAVSDMIKTMAGTYGIPPEVSIGIGTGYGAYMVVIGGILAVLSALGLKMEKAEVSPLATQ